FQKMLAVAVLLREGKKSPLDAVQAFPRPTFESLNMKLPSDDLRKQPILEQRRVAAAVLSLTATELVQFCRIQPELDAEFGAAAIEHPRPLRIVFGERDQWPSSLLGALTIQLLSALAGTGFTTCAHCGGVYTPTRRPARNRKNYCGPECKRAGQRENERKW